MSGYLLFYLFTTTVPNSQQEFRLTGLFLQISDAETSPMFVVKKEEEKGLR